MTHLIAGLFKNSKEAGKAVAELKKEGFTENISIIAKDETDGEIKTHDIKKDMIGDTTKGAAAGAGLGGLIGLLVGVGTVVVPGLGALIIAGPLAAAWGLTGAATGAVAGGLIAALVNAGIPKEKAKTYEQALKRGDTIVFVSADHDQEATARRILEKHNIKESATAHVSYAV